MNLEIVEGTAFLFGCIRGVADYEAVATQKDTRDSSGVCPFLMPPLQGGIS